MAELLAALSLASDLAHNLPTESALRNALIAVGIGRRQGLAGQDLSDIYYLSLLHHIGCTGAAVFAAQLAEGEDIDLFFTFFAADYADRLQIMGKTLTSLNRHRSAATRARTTFNLMTKGDSTMKLMQASTCEGASRLAARLGMTSGVCAGLYEVYSRWDGKIFAGAAGDGISLASRIVHVAHVAEFFHRRAGRQAAAEVVGRRAGTELDPDLARMFVTNADDLLAPMEAGSLWDAALDAEPEPQRCVPRFRLQEIAAAFADFTDLKSPLMMGHSKSVAELAARAGGLLGMDRELLTTLKIAALLHDLGQVSVPNGIWEKRDRLSPGEFERVRLHPYFTERILSHSALLAPYGQLAGLHHERLDGSGYHRGLRAANLPAAARVLAAADTYHALIEEAPYRPRMAPAEAAKELEAEAASGRLDREVVGATIAAAGQKVATARAAWPGGLTEREVGVLREVARGRTNKEIARTLFISDATVHSHVLNIYTKIGVNSRAGAALFAMENDLVHA
ncbi:MAG TPA: HD domain-containing phosphohydrolase [Candidatus Dormibacteraeota bacterium]|nr:HD domain-containing phosphohydrolase [Candidatus Dormibacteraeota bacterium]